MLPPDDECRAFVFNKHSKKFEPSNLEKFSELTMPRGGSKRGEQRGKVKRQILSGSHKARIKKTAPDKPPLKRGPKRGKPSNNPNGRTKGGVNKATIERLAVLTAELSIETRAIMPNKILLEISRIFYEMALKDRVKLEQNPDDTAIFAAFERHLVLASDVGYKAANFYHPRLTAIAMKDVGDQRSSEQVLQQLLDEIDTDARAERAQQLQIEHLPAAPSKDEEAA